MVVLEVSVSEASVPGLVLVALEAALEVVSEVPSMVEVVQASPSVLLEVFRKLPSTRAC